MLFKILPILCEIITSFELLEEVMVRYSFSNFAKLHFCCDKICQLDF